MYSSNFSSTQESASLSHVALADGSMIKVKRIGTLYLNLSLPLSSTLYIPKLAFNLMSVSKLTKRLQHFVTFFHEFFVI